VLGLLKAHCGVVAEIELETCINGSIYCLMSVPHLKIKARAMGLREMLEERLKTCNNEQVVIQIRHIFAKMDEPALPSEEGWNKQDQDHLVINEADEEHEDDEDRAEAPADRKPQQSPGFIRAEDEEEEDEDEDDFLEEEEDDGDETDEKMSISEFSNDEEFAHYYEQPPLQDNWTYLEESKLI